jgi:hypothetical protein
MLVPSIRIETSPGRQRRVGARAIQAAHRRKMRVVDFYAAVRNGNLPGLHPLPRYLLWRRHFRIDIPTRGCAGIASWIEPQPRWAPRVRRRQHCRERIVTPPKVMEKRGRHMKCNEAEQGKADSLMGAQQLLRERPILLDQRRQLSDEEQVHVIAMSVSLQNSQNRLR